MMRPSRSLIVAIAALAPSCAPGHRDTGEAVLIVWPLVMLLSALPQAVLVRMWQWRWPELVIDWRPFLIFVGMASVVSVSMVMTAAAPWEWAPHALWLFGTSYLAALLVITRVLISFRLRAVSFVPAHAGATMVFIPFAMGLRAGFFETATVDPAGYFVFPGYGGWVPGAIAVALLLECWYQRRRQ